MITVTLCLVLVGVALTGADPKYCCSPDQWEGYSGQLSGFVHRGHPAIAQGFSQISYDFTGKKVAVTHNVTVHDHHISYKLIVDFKNGYGYFIDDRGCKTKKLNKTMKQACVPDSAKKMGDFYYGAGSSTLKSTSYMLEIPKMHATAFIVVTQDNCVPVGESVFGASREGAMMSNVGFVDITKGIKDPAVFTPPASCKTLEEEELHEIFFLQYMEIKFTEE